MKSIQPLCWLECGRIFDYAVLFPEIKLVIYLLTSAASTSNAYPSNREQLMYSSRNSDPVIKIGSSLYLHIYVRGNLFMTRMDRRKCRNTGFQYSHLYFSVNWVGSSVSNIFKLFRKSFMIFAPADQIGGLLNQEWKHIWILYDPNHVAWPPYEFFYVSFRFVPGVRRICPLLTVIVRNDLKSLSNSVDVLSIHD